jgi:hypothetical protein
MKETTPAAMPPCFEKWCQKLDQALKTKAQKRELRHYLGGLLGESERKNLTQISDNAVGVEYEPLHHFMTDSPWSWSKINERRLQIISQCRQTKISRSFSLIIDDSGHRKSGNFTDCVGRQYIGEIGKTDNGNVIVTTHIYDGIRSFPLDVELYQKAENFEKGEKDPAFKKKPEIAIKLIEKCLERNDIPEVVLIDGGYGNNSNLLNKLEEKKLKYIGGIAKNRKVKQFKNGKLEEEKRLDKIAELLPESEFKIVKLGVKKLWVAVIKAEIEKLSGLKTIAIVMNANSFEKATEIDYLITNESHEKATAEWIVSKYSQRNWIEVFYREIKGWLGLSEYQLRNKNSLMKHFILVFCAYTFIQWHRLTGGFRRRWANKPLNTFTEALEAFRTAVSCRFVKWLNKNIDVFIAYKASLGFVWA